MNALVELMGSLSNVRFATVSDRFIAELEKYKIGAPVKDKDRELRMEMLIRGMRYLNLKVYAIANDFTPPIVFRIVLTNTRILRYVVVSYGLFGRNSRLPAELCWILQNSTRNQNQACLCRTFCSASYTCGKGEISIRFKLNRHDI